MAEAETLEVEIQKYREESSELRRRLADTSTLETSLKKAEAKADTLEEKVSKYPAVAWHTIYIWEPAQMETLIQERVAQKENELNATYDEKLLNYEERCAIISSIQVAKLTCITSISERDLQRQLKLTKDQLREFRASNETNQAKLLDQSERQGEESPHHVSSLPHLTYRNSPGSQR